LQPSKKDEISGFGMCYTQDYRITGPEEFINGCHVTKDQTEETNGLY